jgi:hypothetical protein
MVSVTRSIAVLVLIGIMAQINSIAVYCGLFSMNRKAIASAVCEKKTRDCCGGCFLKKKIASTQEDQPASSEKTLPNKSSEHHLELMPSLEPSANNLKILPSVGARFALTITDLTADGHLPPVYQPPDTFLHTTIC